jgi:hypothetical protein
MEDGRTAVHVMEQNPVRERWSSRTAVHIMEQNPSRERERERGATELLYTLWSRTLNTR